MMKSAIVFILILFTIHSDVVVENPCGTMVPREEGKNWGEGAFLLPDTFTLSIYKDTKGQKVGTLRIGVHKGEFRLSNNKENRFREFYRYNIDWLGYYEATLLMVKKSENSEYFKTLWSENDSILYIKSQDLVDIGATYFTYKEYLFKNQLPEKVQQYREWANVGVNLAMSCLNLRIEPNINSEIVHCVRGNDWPSDEGESTHFKILESKGNWAKVKSTTLVMGPEDYDCPTKVKSKREGWVKAIDDNGFPNIWYSVTGY